jgi:DNA-binding winged helix-turn-helix (wHTH) protein
MSSGAPSPEPPNDVYAFGPFVLEVRERRLLRDGQAVPLTVKAFDLLEALVRRPGRLVLKEELLSLVWPDAVVEENNLTVTMSALRKALGEGSTLHGSAVRRDRAATRIPLRGRGPGGRRTT